MAKPKHIKKPTKRSLSKKTPWFKQYSAIVASSVILLLLILFVVVNELQKSQDIRSRAQLASCQVAAEDYFLDSEETKLLDLVNTYRQQNNLPVLIASENLNRMAAWLSKDMSAKNYLEHTDSLNRTPAQRAAECGSSYDAENIAMNTASDATTIFNQWKESPGHNENMLDPELVYTGIAKSGSYWTQDFAKDDVGSGIQPTISLPIQPTANPTVPNPGCLGSCPTIAPSVTSVPTGDPDITNSPSISPIDGIDTSPTIEPTPGYDIENPGGGGGNQGGFIELLLQFFRLLMELFASLFR